jgi:hypothetical protein
MFLKLREGRSAYAPRWCPPPTGACKLNMDEEVAKTLCCYSVGVVCRSREGAFMGAPTIVFNGVTDPRRLEAMACREGMALATNLHVGEIVVAWDCTEVVQGLLGHCMDRFSNVLREIKNSVKQRGDVSFHHERRSSNGEAHFLARLATKLSTGCHVWLGTLPDGLSFPVSIVNNNQWSGRSSKKKYVWLGSCTFFCWFLAACFSFIFLILFLYTIVLCFCEKWTFLVYREMFEPLNNFRNWNHF